MVFAECDVKEAAEWDAYVGASANGHLFQTLAWGEVARLLGWTPYRYCVKKDACIVAVAQVLKRSRGPFSLLYVPRGPVFSSEEGFRILMAGLRRVLREQKAFFCRINPRIEKPHDAAGWYLSEGLVPSRTRDMHVCTYQIDLGQSQETIWKNFRGSVRTEIRRAEKNGVRIEAGATEQCLKEFQALYLAAAERGKVTAYEPEFFRELLRAFAAGGQVRISNAYHGESPVASSFVFICGGRVELMWSVKAAVLDDFGGNQLIVWKDILRAKEQGCRWYDFGGVPPNKEDLPGIHFYKKSFGGQYAELLGEYALVRNPALFFLWERLGRTYSRYRNRKP